MVIHGQLMEKKWVISGTEKKPDPKGLSTFSQCTEFLPNSYPLDLELAALTKMASQPDASLSLGRLHYMLNTIMKQY